MASKPVSIGGFSGLDNVHRPDAQTFQIPGPQENRRMALTAAVDVSLDDDGWPKSRSATTELASLTDGLRGFSGAGLLLVQEAGVISSVNTSTGAKTTLISGLDTTDRVRFHEFDGKVWWCNREYCGRITAAGVATNWGMAVPPTPTLGTTAGDLPAGIYQVAATYVDANGVESGAGKAASVTLDGIKDITATFTVNDPHAVSVRFYVAALDSKGQGSLFWAKTAAVGALPATIIGVSSLYPLKTQFMRGPVPGRGIASYKDMLMTWRDQWVYPSSGISPHLFYTGKEAFYFPAKVQAVAGIETGVWIATEQGIWYLQGDSLKTMIKVQLDKETYARGSLVLDGYKLPTLQATGKIALFVNSGGLVVGLPGGQLLPLTRDRLTVGDVLDQQASITYSERDDLKQVLFALSDAPTEGASYYTVTNPVPTFD